MTNLVQISCPSYLTILRECYIGYRLAQVLKNCES